MLEKKPSVIRSIEAGDLKGYFSEANGKGCSELFQACVVEAGGRNRTRHAQKFYTASVMAN